MGINKIIAEIIIKMKYTDIKGNGLINDKKTGKIVTFFQPQLQRPIMTAILVFIKVIFGITLSCKVPIIVLFWVE